MSNAGNAVGNSGGNPRQEYGAIKKRSEQVSLGNNEFEAQTYNSIIPYATADSDMKTKSSPSLAKRAQSAKKQNNFKLETASKKVRSKRLKSSGREVPVSPHDYKVKPETKN